MTRPMIFPIQYPEKIIPSSAARSINERNVADRSFTLSERTVAKLTMTDIIAKAKDVMSGAPMCMDVMGRFNHNDQFTVAASSELIQRIVNDSRYYNQVY